MKQTWKLLFPFIQALVTDRRLAGTYLKELHPYTEKQDDIVFVNGHYTDIREENSVDGEDSYQYRYVKPKCIQTSNGDRIDLDAVLLTEQAAGREMLPGVTVSSWKACNSYKERKITLQIELSEDACPVRIGYTVGEGCGYSDSGYNDSSRREMWVTYLKDVPEIRSLFKG